MADTGRPGDMARFVHHAEDWYHDDYLVHLREVMLRAHIAWKAAATCEIADDGLSHQQTLLMDDARRAIDTYMEHRTRCQAARRAPR
jgi:hypothetical protein